MMEIMRAVYHELGAIVDAHASIMALVIEPYVSSDRPMRMSMSWREVPGDVLARAVCKRIACFAEVGMVKGGRRRGIILAPEPMQQIALVLLASRPTMLA